MAPTGGLLRGTPMGSPGLAYPVLPPSWYPGAVGPGRISWYP